MDQALVADAYVLRFPIARAHRFVIKHSIICGNSHALVEA